MWNIKHQTRPRYCLTLTIVENVQQCPLHSYTAAKSEHSPHGQQCELERVVSGASGPAG